MLERGRLEVADGRDSRPTSHCADGTAQGAYACVAGRAARHARHPARHCCTAGRSGAAELTPLRSARVPIGLGLMWTRTNAPQSRTNWPGSQKCPKWPPGKVLPRPFKFHLTVSFQAFTRPVAAIPRWFRTPPSLKTTLSHRDLYELITSFKTRFLQCPEALGRSRGPWPKE